MRFDSVAVPLWNSVALSFKVYFLVRRSKANHRDHRVTQRNCHRGNPARFWQNLRVHMAYALSEPWFSANKLYEA